MVAGRRSVVGSRETHSLTPHTLPLRPPHKEQRPRLVASLYTHIGYDSPPSFICRYNALVVCFLAIPIVVVMELGRFHEYARERSMGQCVAILSLGAFITCAFVLLSNVLLSVGARYAAFITGCTQMHSSMYASMHAPMHASMHASMHSSTVCMHLCIHLQYAWEYSEGSSILLGRRPYRFIQDRSMLRVRRHSSR